MDFRKILGQFIKATPAIDTKQGSLAADLAVDAVLSVDRIKKPSAARIKEIETIARRVAGTEWGQSILEDGMREVLAALDRGSFKRVLAIARFVAGLLDTIGVERIDVGNSILNWIIETALQALRSEQAA